MSESSRNGEFDSGRFYETITNGGFGSAGWSHSAGWESFGQEPKQAAAVVTDYHPDVHFNHHRPHMHDTLFDSIPERHHVEHAYASEGATHHIPTLLGLAAVNSLQRRGKLPKPSDSLSPHSAKLANTLADRGIIDPPEEGGKFTNVNNIGRKQGLALAMGEVAAMREDFHGNINHANPERVAGSRQFVRDALRNSRPKKPANTGEQLELFPR